MITGEKDQRYAFVSLISNPLLSLVLGNNFLLQLSANPSWVIALSWGERPEL